MSVECPVCGGSGWVRAAPVSPRSLTHKQGRVAMWAHSVVVPCFNCAVYNTPIHQQREMEHQ